MNEERLEIIKEDFEASLNLIGGSIDISQPDIAPAFIIFKSGWESGYMEGLQDGRTES